MSSAITSQLARDPARYCSGNVIIVEFQRPRDDAR
jgi:hypothetical protein